MADTKQQLAVHTFKKHGQGREMRAFITGSVCECCLRQFHTRERLLCHVVEKAARCVKAYKTFGSRADQEIIDEEEASAKIGVKGLTKEGLRRHIAKYPVIRAEGPHRKEFYEQGLSHKSLLVGAQNKK